MKTKKVISTVLVLVLAFACMTAFSACDAGTADTDKVYKIGICQLVTHDALDAATEGFKQALIDELGADKVEFDYQNAANSNDTCVTIVNNFVSKNVDLILANATGALQAAVNATETIPILGTSITEYGVALEIDDFNGTVGGNVSGTSDLAPLTEQAQMILDLFPQTEKVGLLSCSAEPNSAYQVAEVKAYLEAKGIVCTEYTFVDSNDVSLVAEKAATDSDVIYIPTDNTAASCAETINNIVLPKKVPIIAGEAGICEGCGVATLSISYYELGYTTGKMAVQILKGEADIATMPIAYDPNPVKKYNKEICEELQVEIPADYVALGE